ncbi:MAG: BON domain-containing protein [Fuerstiella sp.]|nr:BON domain-containing protein [Fuerstiella sp.]MCP4855918.1 BON domain-containing protein [Fuerstiella sp.]
MRKYGKWLLVLGILAANPAWVSAQGVANRTSPGTAMQLQNQRVAEHISAALRQARLNGYDIDIVVRGGTVKLDGKVREVTHRALATRVCQQVEGISKVQNNLRFVPGGVIQQTAGTAYDGGTQRATYETVEDDKAVQLVHFRKPGKRQPSNSKKIIAQRQPGNSSQSTNRPPQIRSESTIQRPTPTVRAPKAVAATVPQPKPVASPTPVVSEPSAPALPAMAPATQQQLTPASVSPPTVTATYPEEPPAVPPASSTVAEPQGFPERTTALRPLQVGGSQSQNQQTAQQIADALERVGLTGYEIEIRFEDGIATLAGDVATAEQLQVARIAASTVKGVNEVRIRLQATGPIAQASFVPQGRPMPPVSQASMAMMAGMQATPTAMGTAGAYSNPQLPKHAWPSYAQYPNSAAISYPKQYSASAWPYIGPFYPYPQVPMGWREVSLEWDDGHWQLDFEKKKDAWYWLFKPKNWK